MAPKNEDSDVEEVSQRMGQVSVSPQEEALIQKLKDLDEKYISKKEEFSAKVTALEVEFRQQWDKLLANRTELLKENGSVIPQFWGTALKNCDALEDQIMEWDHPLLDAITDLKFEWLDDAGKKGFKLFFTFAPNDFIENTTVVKTYHTETVSRYCDDLEVDKIECEELRWKPKMNLGMQVVEKKKKQGRKGKPKMVTVEEKRPSFFRFFFRTITPDMELSDEDEDEGSDEESDMSDDDDYDKTEMIMQDDWETGCVLRDCVIPHAVRWYTGEALDDEESSDEGSPRPARRAQDDDSDDSDESDAPPAGGAQKEECKQQ